MIYYAPMTFYTYSAELGTLDRVYVWPTYYTTQYAYWEPSQHATLYYR